MPTALLTGTGRPGAIAAALARRLAREGWDLGLHSFGEDPSEVVAEVRGAGARVHTVEADLGLPDAAASTVDEVRRDLGEITALLLVHTHCETKGLLETTAADLDRHYAVNVRAALLLIQAFAAQLESPDGRVVALTSDHFSPQNLAYGTTKAALDRVVLAAARELGPRGIRANCVNPGPNDTGWMTPEIRDAAVAQTPLGRTSLPEDTADLVEFLVGPRGAWITGQVLYSNGGFRLNPF